MQIETKFFISFTLAVSVICNVNCKITTRTEKFNNVSLYAGEHFPERYFEEDAQPTVTDLDHYIDGLSRVMNYFASINLNASADMSKSFSIYLVRGLIKRTIMDYWEILDTRQYQILLDILEKGAIIWDNFMSILVHNFQTNLLYRMTLTLNDPMTFAHSLDGFKRNKLRKWIRRNFTINDYVEDMDKLILSRSDYMKLMYMIMADYGIRITDSDFCVGRAAYNPDPINITEMRPCKPDPYCLNAISATPSISYTLSHRTLNLFLYRLTRRCYFESIEKDEEHIESLCAQMYRESVYIARRGFFARDIFMEHVGFCTLLGYEEFFRKNWFHKMISWTDAQGCIIESMNLNINRTAYLKQIFAEIDENIDVQASKLLEKQCHVHVMSMFVMSMASAVRHAAHHVAFNNLVLAEKRSPHRFAPVSKIKHI